MNDPAPPSAVDPLAHPAADYHEQFVEVEPGVRLLAMCWSPRCADPGDPVLFVAGWVSTIKGWASLIEGLAGTRPVIYLETREKRSAEIERGGLRPADFSIPRNGEDLIAACVQLELPMERTTIVASSMGAAIALEALKGGRLTPRTTPRAAFLIAPTADFHMPWWGPALMTMPSQAYHVLKYLLLWYLRHFRVDVQREPEQMERYEYTVRNAHPLRIKLSGQAVRSYQVWPDLDRVTVPVGIAYAPSDALHGVEAIERMRDALADARTYECPSNLYLHRAAVIAELDRFLGSVDGAAG